VLSGLLAPEKHLPCRLLYDARGAAVFETISTLDEYYVTRNEHLLVARHLPELASMIAPSTCVIEPGRGSGIKTRALLSALDRPVSDTPIDVSGRAVARDRYSPAGGIPDDQDLSSVHRLHARTAVSAPWQRAVDARGLPGLADIGPRHPRRQLSHPSCSRPVHRGG